MITKNQTKYSYARKLFALPILFFMVFAYMVNAKNKEITETNKAIEIAVKQIKMDTIQPKQSEFDSLANNHQRQTKAYSDALQEDHLKMSAISKKMSEKGKELSALKKAKKEESPEYKALENEMESLAAQMEDVVNSDNYKRNIKGLEEHSEAMAKMYDSPEFMKKIADAEKVARKAEAMVNSKDFKKKIADAEKRAATADKMVNSPEFKKRIADAEKRAEEVVVKVNSPEFQKMSQEAQKRVQEAVEKYGKVYSEADLHKMIKDQFGKDAFTDANVAYGFDASDFPEFQDLATKFNFNFSDDVFNSAKSKLSPKELKKLEKKRIKLLEEQKKLQKKQQELNKEYQKNNPLKISFIPQVDRSSVTILQNGKLAANNYKTNLFINGRAVDSAELQKIDPARISTMNVITDNNLNTVKIYTK